MKTTIKLFALAAILLLTTTAWATNVTLKVLDSQGNPISGVPISIHKYNVGGQGTFNTDINGEITVDLPNYTPGYGYKFSAAYEKTYASYTQTIAAGDEGTTIHTFQTTLATIKVADCNGAPIAGADVTYHNPNAGGGSLGTTGPSGTLDKELFSGTYSFKAVINKTREQTNVDISPSGVDHTFSPAQVNLNYSGLVKIWQSNIGGTVITPGIYLFPGTYDFNFGNGVIVPLTVGDCNAPALSGTVAILNLKDHNGDPLTGGKARGGKNSSIQFHVPGTTDANGNIVYIGTGAPTMTFEMRYNGTTQTFTQLLSSNSTFSFQTAELRVRMETCSGDPVDGGTARFKNGSHKYWLNNNVAGNSNTGDAGPGEAAGEVFPGTYDVDMQFRYGENTQTVVVTAGGGSTTFKTTNVAISYPNTLTYKKLGGSYAAWYSQPSMEFLPGDYEFNFTGGGTVPMTVGSCGSPIVLNAVFVKLETSLGAGIAGATAKYYASGWKTAGTTDANGFALVNDPLISGNTKFRVEDAGLSNEKWQNISSNAIVVFATELVTFDLEESDGDPIAGATTKYYAGGWNTFGSGTTSTSMELLPTNTKFRVEHDGISNEKWQNTGANPAVVFATTLVTFDLETSLGAPIAGATTKYYAGGWQTFGSGTTSTSMELLPINTKFRVEHGGLSNEKWQNTGTNPNVVFSTILVDFVLKNSHNTQFLTPDATKYYAGGWQTFTGQTIELLSGNVKFRVEYRGHSNEKWQNIGSNPNVQFNTQKRVLSATNTTYGLQPGVYKWKYYAGGWHDLDPNNTSYTSNITYSTLSKKLQAYSELLPGNVKFRVETPCGNAEQWSTYSHITLDVACDLSNKSADASAPDEVNSGIVIYPNPASSQITIEATGEVNIFNASGKLMYSGTAGTLEVSAWARGMYMIKADGEVKKLILD